MLPIVKILFPTDFSEPSYEALKTANELASHFSAELILIHVVSTTPVIPASPGLTGFHLPKVIEEMKGTAQKSLEGMVREKVEGETRSRAMVVTGNPPDEIARVATDEKVDLLVIATHGLSGWRKFIFGSVAEKVAKLSPCPVLLVQSPSEET
ncbi:MAG: universal stress protein [Desulfobacteraceae bacterium]|jgi:nucleotide-binding universal stress UspA family protein